MSDQEYKRSIPLLIILAALILSPLCLKPTARYFYGFWQESAEIKRIAFFNENFEAFLKLEQMQREDISLISSINLRWVYGENTQGVSQDRISEYRKLMEQAGIEALSYTWQEPKKRMVRFYEDVNSPDYGYVYMEYPPPRFYKSHKDCKPIMPSNSCYILLKKNWYMFSEKYRLEQY